MALPQNTAPSQNTTVEFRIKASSLRGLSSYGEVQIGDRAFEYYNERSAKDFIQIPWEEVDYVSAEVLPGRHISRFAIFTKANGHYTFSTRDNKATLRAVREHVPADRLLKSMNFFQVVGHGIMYLPHQIKAKRSGAKQGNEGEGSSEAPQGDDTTEA